jgi:hypothetical protein
MSGLALLGLLVLFCFAMALYNDWADELRKAHKEPDREKEKAWWDSNDDDDLNSGPPPGAP